ncbi:2-ketoisovalerate ferredoxin oxidoreductase [candidate division KSB1 bacterium]|nr:MAG: 2-ketoisovalerate ferredoxin oxidoreductase [candidate division KSB1 bacterium]
MADKNDKKINISGASDMPPMAASLGSMRQNKTASWRSIRPIIDEDKCKNCMICWKFCPEPAIFPTAPPTIDYDFCKGCGICIEECPFDAISSVKEGK